MGWGGGMEFNDPALREMTKYSFDVSKPALLQLINERAEL